MALATGTKLTPQLEEIISKQIKSPLNQLLEHHKSQLTPEPKTFVHQDWMFVSPKTPGETCQHHGKTFNCCIKCHQGCGQLVSAHGTNL
jgi:hypothetical protein